MSGRQIRQGKKKSRATLYRISQFYEVHILWVIEFHSKTSISPSPTPFPSPHMWRCVLHLSFLWSLGPSFVTVVFSGYKPLAIGSFRHFTITFIHPVFEHIAAKYILTFGPLVKKLQQTPLWNIFLKVNRIKRFMQIDSLGSHFHDCKTLFFEKLKINV